MTQAREIHRDNIIIGAGEVYLDLFDANGAKTGERYLGDAVSATLGIATEETTVFSGTGPVAEELSRVVRQITRQFTLTLHDISMENLQIFVIGEPTPVGPAVMDETIAVAPDRFYPLGVSAANPAGWSRVDQVAVTGGTVDAGGTFTAAAAAWVEGTDYAIEAAAGRVHVFDTAATQVAMAAIQVDYTPDGMRVQSTTHQIRGAFRYIETPADGEGRNFYAPDCNIRPSGDLSLLDGRNTEQQIGLTVAALEPPGGLRALYIDGLEA